MDFNCLIYNVARAYEEVYPGGGGGPGEDWERGLCKRVAAETVRIWKEVGRPAQFVVCIDGVVPMAKIRQQRTRRFKSSYLRGLGGGGASKENPGSSAAWDRTSGTRKESPGSSAAWDLNCITPGTAFMRRLSAELEGVRGSCAGAQYTLSTADEAGEGEHKVMRWISANGGSDEEAEGAGPILVYGLDADLILLTLIASTKTNRPIWLMREDQEFAGLAPSRQATDSSRQATDSSRQATGSATPFVYMNMTLLREVLGLKTTTDVYTYVALMSCMGNDFIPHSITHKLTEDGHGFVLREIQKRRPILKQVDGRWVYNEEEMRSIWRNWAKDEPTRMLTMIQKKREAARRPIQTMRNGVPVSEYESWPLQWDVEQTLCAKGAKGLREGWDDAYWRFLHPSADRQALCQEYIHGLQWVLDYYLSQGSVDQSWMFPAWCPPLWSDLATVEWPTLRSPGPPPSPSPSPQTPFTPLQPKEQLALVLPPESWWLLEDSALRSVVERAPQYFPAQFQFHSLGKKQLWECEAILPVLMPEKLRALLRITA